jgi:pimeloyl-ACP methyl ester carboxylesterase
MKSGYIDLRGHQVYSYEWENNGDAVLLLHGGLSQTSHFDFTVLPAVEDKHHVFGYDRTAHGYTGDREGSLHFTFQYEEAVSYLEDVVKEPAHLIGHSDGAIIAFDGGDPPTRSCEISCSLWWTLSLQWNASNARF